MLLVLHTYIYTYIYRWPFFYLPWYNSTGWLGVKHQFTYLLFFYCALPAHVMCKHLINTLLHFTTLPDKRKAERSSRRYLLSPPDWPWPPQSWSWSVASRAGPPQSGWPWAVQWWVMAAWSQCWGVAAEHISAVIRKCTLNTIIMTTQTTSDYHHCWTRCRARYALLTSFDSHYCWIRCMARYAQLIPL